MNRDQFEAYLQLFNGRDYDGVLNHYLPDGLIAFADVRLKGHAEIRRFYDFFHDHVQETILVKRFLGDTNSVMIEATVRLEGKKDLPQAALDEAGFSSLVPLQMGQVLQIPQFIHYHLENGQFAKALCAIANFDA